MGVKCTYCNAPLDWDNGNMRSCNLDGTMHNCEESRAAAQRAYRRKHRRALRQARKLDADFHRAVGRGL